MKLVARAVAVAAAAALTSCTPGQAPDVPPTPPSSTTVTAAPAPTTATPAPTPTATPTSAPTTAPPVPTATPAPPPSSTTPAPAPAGTYVGNVADCVQPKDANGNLITKLADQGKDEQNPWKRADGQKSLIKIDYSSVYDPSLPKAKAGNKEWYDYAQHAVAFWNQSPCLNLVLVNGGCPPKGGDGCAKVDIVSKGDDGNFDEVTKGGFNTGGHITINAGLAGTPINLADPFDKRPCSERLNVTIHEFGHLVGLLHVKTPKVIMDPETYPDVCGVKASDLTDPKRVAYRGPHVGGPDQTALNNIAVGATVLQKR